MKNSIHVLIIYRYSNNKCCKLFSAGSINSISVSMNVRGRVRALREFRTGSSMLTVLKIHEYRSLQFNVKAHNSVFRLYRLFFLQSLQFDLFLLFVHFSRHELVENNQCCQSLSMSARPQISSKYGLSMRRGFSLFFCLCFYTIENRHFLIVILGHLMLNDISSLKFLLQGYIKSILDVVGKCTNSQPSLEIIANGAENSCTK